MSKNENKKANALSDEDLGNISGGNVSGGTSFLEASPEDRQAYFDYCSKCAQARKAGANLATPSFENWEKYHKKRNTSQN